MKKPDNIRLNAPSNNNKARNNDINAPDNTLNNTCKTPITPTYANKRKRCNYNIAYIIKSLHSYIIDSNTDHIPSIVDYCSIQDIYSIELYKLAKKYNSISILIGKLKDKKEALLEQKLYNTKTNPLGILAGLNQLSWVDRSKIDITHTVYSDKSDANILQEAKTKGLAIPDRFSRLMLSNTFTNSLTNAKLNKPNITVNANDIDIVTNNDTISNTHTVKDNNIHIVTDN